jgi:hypothetical protein
VRYTVWSRGHLIGATDLEFMSLVSTQRSGAFHPNEEGERVMSEIASVLPAMRAYLHRDLMDEKGNGFVHPSMNGSTTFADLAEEFQRLGARDLELRRDDGSAVPTLEIGIQDTEHLLPLVEEGFDDDIDTSDADDELKALAERYPELQAAIEHDAALLEQAMREDDPTPDWLSEIVNRQSFPRYQIHVLLSDGLAIP